MAINPIQPNIEPQKTYRDATTPIKTDNLVHPLPAEGHLVHDRLLSIPKFWLKDIAYDIKCVKNGLKGTAKDHETGRLNDVGLKLGGLGIATYLASRTTNPKMRVMEYAGLGTFLASMSLYPMIAINGPSRLVQGFDIGKEYIDDQGRKKSVFQDGNYIPYDLYKGEFAGEDLEIIGDRMGIPRGIKNRDELTKEQMRKIAIQNNTLWMLSAGFATPVMTALICCGLEQILSPAMEIIRNKRYNSKITNLLKQTKEMTLMVDEIDSNNLSKKIEKLLTAFKDKEISKDGFDLLVNTLSDEVDNNLKTGIKEDLEKIFKAEKNGFVLGENFAENINNVIKSSSTGRNNATFNEIFNISHNDITNALKKVGSDEKYLGIDQLPEFKGELKKIFSAKIEAAGGNKEWLYSQMSDVVENISKFVQKIPSMFVSEKGLKDITDFAKVLGDFKAKDRVLDKCNSFKIEDAPETVLARSYKKFENAIFDILDIKYRDLKLMKESDAYTKEILEKKIQALVSNNEKYSKAIEKLAKVMADNQIMLHGESATESYLKDLISAIENNYNNTAKRLHNIGDGKFSRTINKLIKEDINDELKNTIQTRADMFDIIDGIKKPFTPEESLQYGEKAVQIAKENSNGVGSSKELKIARLIARIQGVENSQRRLLHTLDVYKRAIPAEEYEKHINEFIKNAMLGANSRDNTLKLHTDNNPRYYIDIMDRTYNSLEETTKTAMQKAGDISKGDIFGRFEKYLKRFKDIIGNNDIDFNKPAHRVTDVAKYRADDMTRIQKFNLVAQNPIDFFRKASKMRFENQKWLRTASGIGGTVLAATVLMQFAFGKIKNPQNIQKQVSDDTNN